MKRFLFLFLTLLFSVNINSQAITVNNTVYTVPQLVQNVLFASPSGGPSACIGAISNITWSTGSGASNGTSFGSSNGIGFFQNTNPNFPLNSGVILSTGNALSASGPNTTTQSNGNWPGDNDLFNYIFGLGIDTGLVDFNNATILEFDFTPLTTTMSFDFLFASEEYGDYQCLFSDSFAFFLTNVTAGTPTINLALVPNTNSPISVVTIRDGNYYTGIGANCGSTNPTFFGNFNDSTPAVAAAAATNFNGETIKMTASATVIPSNIYHIKLVVADRNDDIYDSAVFLGGGSFNIGTIDISGTGTEFGGQTDFSGVRSICNSKPLTVKAGLFQIPGANYSWTLNGNPIGGNTFQYTITQQGNYGVTITYPGGCIQTDSILVEYIPSLVIGTPNNLTQCSAPFNLTSNSATILNGLTASISFHRTLIQAQQLAAPIINPSNYAGTNGEIIYVAVEDDATGCISTTQFTLITDSSLCALPIQPSNLVICDDISNDGFAIFDFSTQNPIILGTNSSANYTITYHLSQAAANADTGAIIPINSFNNTSNPQTIYVRMEKNANPLIYGTTSFQLIVNPLPTATISGNNSVCKDATSPNITFTGFNGFPPYTFTYSTDGGITLLTTPASTGNTYLLPVPTSALGVFPYTLISVQSTGFLCNQNQFDTATVTVNPLPIITGTQNVCIGLTTQLNSLDAPATANPWVSSNALVATISNTGLVTGVSAGTTTITYTTLTGCQKTATITVDPLPIITGTQNVCIGLTTQLNSLDAPATVNPWVSSNALVATISNTGLVTGVSAGTTTITYTTLTGCQKTAIVTVNPLPIITGTQNVCIGLTTQLNSADAPATVNPWTSSNLLVATINNSGLVTGVSAGTTTITFTNSSGCLSTALVTVNSLPSITGTLNACIGLTTQLNSLDAPATANPWVSSNALVATISNTGLVTGVSAGTTTITYTTLTGCQKTAIVTVNPVPAVIVPNPIFECSNGTVTTATFDLTLNQGVVTGGLPGFSVTYYTSLAAAQNGISFIISPTTYLGSDNEIVYVRVENTATGCFSITNQLLRVTQGPLAITPLPLHYCDPNNDGFGLFDLDSRINAIAGGTLPIGVSVTFHETQTDAELGANPITSPYYNIVLNTQTIYVRVFYILTGCANYVNLQLIVDPTPISPVNLNPLTVCDQDANPQDGITAVDLTVQEAAILAQQTQPITSTFTISYFTSQSNAQSQTAAISNITNYITPSTPIWIRIENNATNCFNIGSFQVVVNKPLLLSTPLPLSLCDNDAILNDQLQVFDLTVRTLAINQGTGATVSYYPSLLDAQNGTNIILNPTAYQNINTSPAVQTLGVVVTTAAGCTSITTLDIRVEPLPTLTPPTTNIEACDGNQDGFGDFDLSSLVPGLLNGITTYTVSFHETLTDAQLGVNDINTSVNYTTITPLMQMLYVRAEDIITGCWSTLPITLNVTPSPIAPINLNPITVCDQDANPQDGSTAVDLTVQEAAILAQQPLPATAYTISYYTSLPDAQSQTAPIINITSYVTTSAEIWIRIENAATGCFNIGSFQVVVNKPFALPTSLPPFSLCDYDANPNNQYHIFDLTIATQAILPLVTGATISYYPSLALAQAGVIGTAIATPTAYTNTLPGVQTLGVVVTTAAGCKSITTLDIRVLPIPTPLTNPPALAPKCDYNLPGDLVEVFDLTINQGYIANGDPNLSFHYFPTQADAIANTNEILTPTAALVATNVWIRVENNGIDYNGNKCYVLVQQPLTVNPLPTIIPLLSYQNCDNDADGITLFNLADPVLTAQVLGTTQLPVNFTVSYYLTAAGANPLTNTGETPLPSSYSNTSSPNTQTIYIRVVNNTTGCSSTGQLILTVNPKPVIAMVMPSMSKCDYDGINNGFMLFTQNTNSTLPSLAGYVNDILGPTQTAPGFVVEFYDNLTDVTTGNTANALTNLATYQVQTGTYYIRVVNTLTGCNAITPFVVVIEKLAEPSITAPTNTICVEWGTNNLLSGVTLNSGITNPNYTFVWSLGGVAIPSATSSTYPINSVAAGDYTVVATSTPPLLGCISKPSNTFSVIQSGPPVFSTPPYTFSAAFDENQNITVNVVGYGVYEYSLDEGPFQASTIFTNVSAGAHTITVRDVEGITSCGQIFIDGVLIINYPHYFTPNGDGIHDTWNIVGLANKPGTKIYIFDRYGKLLKQISATSNGWDGTYNGSQMPSDDYWFTVDYEDGASKQYKAHFTLKR